MLHTNFFIYLFHLIYLAKKKINCAILHRQPKLSNWSIYTAGEEQSVSSLYKERYIKYIICTIIISVVIFRHNIDLNTSATASQQHIHYIITPCGNNISAFFNTNWSDINKWINIKRKCQLSCCFTNAGIKTQLLRIQENRSQACTSSWWRLRALRLFTFCKTMCFFSGYGLLIITQHRSPLFSDSSVRGLMKTDKQNQ